MDVCSIYSSWDAVHGARRNNSIVGKIRTHHSCISTSPSYVFPVALSAQVRRCTCLSGDPSCPCDSQNSRCYGIGSRRCPPTPEARLRPPKHRKAVLRSTVICMGRQGHLSRRLPKILALVLHFRNIPMLLAGQGQLDRSNPTLFFRYVRSDGLPSAFVS